MKRRNFRSRLNLYATSGKKPYLKKLDLYPTKTHPDPTPEHRTLCFTSGSPHISLYADTRNTTLRKTENKTVPHMVLILDGNSEIVNNNI